MVLRNVWMQIVIIAAGGENRVTRGGMRLAVRMVRGVGVGGVTWRGSAASANVPLRSRVGRCCRPTDLQGFEHGSLRWRIGRHQAGPDVMVSDDRHNMVLKIKGRKVEETILVGGCPRPRYRTLGSPTNSASRKPTL